jgi:polyphosphate kinase
MVNRMEGRLGGCGITEKERGESPFLEDPSLFFNRELSWLEFNRRVLSEATDQTHPLLERVKFLSIFSNNLDEYFMIRVSGLQRQLARGVREAPPDGMSPALQLAEIHRVLEPMLAQQSDLWEREIVPALREAGIHILSYKDLSSEYTVNLRDYFYREVYPVLTPLAFNPSHPFPFISNLSLNLAVILKHPSSRTENFARIKVPTNLFPRLIRAPAGCGASDCKGDTCLIFLEELIAANLDLLFPGYTVEGAFPFRVTRDADLEIEEDEASDLLTVVEEGIGMRRVGSPVRIEVAQEMPSPACGIIGKKLGIAAENFYKVRAPLGMADLMELSGLDRPSLKDLPFVPSVPPGLGENDRIFSHIRERDELLFHPYESFTPVINMLHQAATDPAVLAIKITLYRVGKNSPIVNALLEARENGKVVAALIELKARFDEENNIGWARALERAGVHVVYGLPGLKVHSKICMVVRREQDGLRTYVHLGTGNYNATSSRIYTDFGLFTADPAIGADAADLFNSLTGCATAPSYRKLLVAPHTLRQEILSRIEREIERHREYGDGCIIFKMNALVDRDCIVALYRASGEGVRVTLQVRGICCLRPGVRGVSETIGVTSLVGRFLEHARLYYFRNGGDEEVFLGSADLMPRNLDRRVEVLFPVEDRALASWLMKTIVPVHLDDTVKNRMLHPDGTYTHLVREPGQPAVNAQEWCIAHRAEWPEQKLDGTKKG